MSDFKFSIPLEVRFRDLDAFGHVNNAVYLTYFEIARCRYWIQMFGIHSFEEIGFLVVRTECNYRLPVRFGQTVRVAARISELRNSSFVFEYEVADDEDKGRLVADGKSVQVFIDPKVEQKIMIPPEIRLRISEFEGIS
ncbi:MAG TPA: thioesterase family protein [Terriglobia bacterium]|nr:thioesterase family protein [Terriglobia bacterium]